MKKTLSVLLLLAVLLGVFLIAPVSADAASEFDHEAFTIKSPLKSGTYEVDQKLDIQIYRKKWIAIIRNGWLQDELNHVFVEISKGQTVKTSIKTDIYRDNVGSTLSRSFTPDEIGEYVVRVGFSTDDTYRQYGYESFAVKLTDNNFVGSYTFNVVEKIEKPKTDDKPAASGYTVKAPVISSLKNTVSGVAASWNKPTGAEKFRVYRKLGTGSWTKLGDTTGLSWTDKKAVSGKKYSYAIRCLTKDAKKFTSALGTAKSITYIAAPKLSAVKKVSGGVKLTWKKSAGAVKYRVFRKVGKGKWAKLADTKSLSIVDKKVKKNTKYTYTVACITANGKTVVSAYNPTGKAITYK